MKIETCCKKEYPAHTVTVSRGAADNGLGEEPSYRVEIRYKSLYRLKKAQGRPRSVQRRSYR